MIQHLHILLLEDDIHDVELITTMLKRSGLNFTYLVATGKDEFEAALQTQPFDVILADNSLPQFDAVSALSFVQQKKYSIPFILVTGTVSEEFAVDVLHKGADDYILKGNLGKLPTAIENAISRWKIKKEKSLAEKALQESEQRYRILFESASDGIVLADKTTQIIDANERACGMTGYLLQELKQLTIAQVFFETDLAAQPIRIEELLQGKIIISERRVKRKDNRHIFVELSASQLPDGRLQAIARDITYRKQLEERLMNQKINHQKKLAQATLDGQEKERTEIGRELHDNVNQILSATKLYLTTAESDDLVKDDMLARSISNVSLAIEEIRKLSKSLVTPALKEMSLQEYLDELLGTFEATTKLTIRMKAHRFEEEKINSHQQIAIYRIVQEQMNNIMKHAHAQQVDICLATTADAVSLEIKDNGIGFNRAVKKNGIGINNMQSRAELLNGTLNFITEPGKGCLLKVKLPINN